MSGLGYICKESDGICELCGKNSELRPYGFNGEMICFECMMKDEKTAERQANKYLFGKGV